MSFRIVIPARYASSRLPGKPLASIAGRPMIAHVWARACESRAQEVVIATDDARVYDAVASLGAEAEMTAVDHASGTDRIEEVARRRGWPDDCVVVNVQGDEPLMPAAVIDQVAANLLTNPDAGMATLCEPINRGVDLANPNVVKVVADARGFALYFSRAPIPWDRERFQGGPGDGPLSSAGAWRRHLGIYAYRVGLLHRFVTWPPAPLEQLEFLEQLRPMHQGVRIHVEDACATVPGGIDTPEDLERVRARLGGA
ncbi:MAG: 3-deoxy-manno-octulosonate cytidylyltransferase [Pseudomonadales bacterium]|jgi:3-deoxy-manno-octulosonate cytidylyltransferase (CMP-KDO synthetase)|nr:3-deoxy-manno-octulosonate cytidylyltransferase [Pseudomonadales bacterium]